jgi:uncharacterized membrane protein YjjP (DUF1212 family)
MANFVDESPQRARRLRSTSSRARWLAAASLVVTGVEVLPYATGPFVPRVAGGLTASLLLAFDRLVEATAPVGIFLLPVAAVVLGVSAVLCNRADGGRGGAPAWALGAALTVLVGEIVFLASIALLMSQAHFDI